MNTKLVFRTSLGAALLAIVFSLAVSARPDNSYVKGIVKSPSGNLFTSVWVIVSQNGYEKGRSLTGDDGKYYISNLSDGVYDVAVYQGRRQIYKGQVYLRADTRRHDISIR